MYLSTIVSTPRSSSITSPTPGGMTETEMTNISGPEVMQEDYRGSISVSAESMEIVSTIH
jgi:hypothetical protein